MQRASPLLLKLGRLRAFLRAAESHLCHTEERGIELGNMSIVPQA